MLIRSGRTEARLVLRAKLGLLAAERPRGPFRMPRVPPGELAIAAVARTRRESLVTVNDGSKFGQRASPTAFNAIGRRHDDSYGTRARGATLEVAHRFASNLIQADHNDDGWLCIKFDKHRLDTFTFHDNLRQHGRP